MNATSIPFHRSSTRIGLSLLGLLGLFVLLVLWSLGVRARWTAAPAVRSSSCA